MGIGDFFDPVSSIRTWETERDLDILSIDERVACTKSPLLWKTKQKRRFTSLENKEFIRTTSAITRLESAR
jgi:hypothetical protein